jgi:3-isopropylmalate dehydrogenase
MLATMAVLGAVAPLLNIPICLDQYEIGLAVHARDGTTLPDGVLDACRNADAILLGPVSHSDYPSRAHGGINVSSELRIVLDLYANIRPSRSRSGLNHYGRTPMDLVIVRENTEGFYADRNMHLGSGEFMPTADTAIALRRITTHASTRIARAAFDVARQRRRRVTAVHKANVLKITDGLFLRQTRKVASEQPDIAYDEQLVDSMAARLVRDAQSLDVVLTTNMFGDILSDEATELSGSLGLGGAINVSETYCMAQAQHGSAPDIAGQDKANPVSMILSSALALEWFGRRHHVGVYGQASRAIEAAVDTLLADPERRTLDLGGALGTTAFTGALIDEIPRQLLAG